MSEESVVPSRLNGVIGVLESGGTAFLRISPVSVDNGVAVASSPFDGVMWEMEHNPFSTTELRLTMQAMLNRREIAESASVAPKVTPLVRIPPNGSEMNSWVAKQVLDSGAYGIIWPHVCTVDEARNAVAACRYPRPPGSERFEPAGLRGDAPTFAARYWGLTAQEYYKKADVWPLAPDGEIFVIIQCEDAASIKHLPDVLSQVPGIGAVMIGEGDLSQDLGMPRQYEHPTVVSAMDEILAICKDHDVPCAHPHAGTKNIEGLVEKGYRMLFANPEPSFAAVELGRRAVAARA